MKKLQPVTRIIIAVSALLMVSAYFVPLWQILMWAPQYPEGLEMKIWIDDITGDVRIISALNHYIGMRHIEVEMFPEFGYMIYIVGAVIALGLITALVNRRAMLVFYAVVIFASGIAALVDFYLWGYDYGHNLDPTAPIVVPGMSYQPPLIGTKQLLNFTAFSGPDVGGWIFLVAGLLAIGALIYELKWANKKNINNKVPTTVTIFLAIWLFSCSAQPEPKSFGKDGCHFCKMTLMDQRFGAEIVTKKGKIFKFDDVSCLLAFIKQGEVQESDIAELLVVDYSQSGKLIDAKSASYLKSDLVKSPMASNLAAFQSENELEAVKKELNGSVLSWDNVNE